MGTAASDNYIIQLKLPELRHGKQITDHRLLSILFQTTVFGALNLNSRIL